MEEPMVRNQDAVHAKNLVCVENRAEGGEVSKTIPCPNCGCFRGRSNILTVEKCPVCGDDEIDISADVLIP
jgi:rubrerythrin